VKSFIEMEIKTDKERYYRDSSFPIALFLYAKGEMIAGVNPADRPGVKEFAFPRTPRLEELLQKYKFGDRNDPSLLVQVHTYEQARRELLDLLNDRSR